MQLRKSTEIVRVAHKGRCSARTATDPIVLGTVLNSIHLQRGFAAAGDCWVTSSIRTPLSHVEKCKLSTMPQSSQDPPSKDPERIAAWPTAGSSAQPALHSTFSLWKRTVPTPRQSSIEKHSFPRIPYDQIHPHGLPQSQNSPGPSASTAQLLHKQGHQRLRTPLPSPAPGEPFQFRIFCL